MATDKTFEKVQIYFNFNKEVTGSTKLADSVLYSNLDPTGVTNMAVEMAKIYSWANDVFTFTPTGTNKITIKSSVLPEDSDTTYSFQEGNVAGSFQVRENNEAWQTIAIHSVPTLDSNGKILETFLPSYVDDVIEGYYYDGKFYTTSAHTTEIDAEPGKIYVDIPSNTTYRYGGTTYVPITNPVDIMTGATASTDGVAGLVPAPHAGDQAKFLRGDGTWATAITSDIKVRQALDTSNKNYPLLFSYAETSSTTTNIDNTSRRNNSIYVNPSTGTVTATNFAGKINNHTVNADVPANPVFTDTKVTQNINSDTSGKTYPLIFSYYEVGSTTTTAQTVSRKDTIYATPKDGSITATNFIGNINGMTISGTSGSTYNLNNITKVEASSTNGKIKINGTDTTVYTHPSHTAKTSGLYKITVNSLGHVSEATAVAKADITALGIPGQDTWVAMTAATASAAGTRGTVQPPANSMDKYLRGDNTWVNPIDDIGILTLHCTNGTS